MNRSERNGLRRETKCFDASIRLALCSYGERLDGFKCDEQDKLDRLPDQIRDSDTGEQIEGSIQMLEEISDKIDEMENALDEILSLADATSSFSAPHGYKHKISPGRKGVGFHAVFPSTILERLKNESIRRALSMNEILCRALIKELKMEDDLR